MSWDKILTELNIKDGATAAGILTSDGSTALTSHGSYPAADTDTVALGLVNDGGTVKWTLVSDLGDASTSTELNTTQTSLGAYIAGNGDWNTPNTAGTTIQNATSISNALDLLDTAINSISTGADLDADYVGSTDGDIITWDQGGTTYTVESKANFLSNTQTKSDYLEAVHDAFSANSAAGTFVSTTTINADGVTVDAQAVVNVQNWNDAYSWGDHSTANYLNSETFSQTNFNATEAANITAQHITDLGTLNTQNGNWTTAYNWGDHSTYNYADATTVATNLAAVPGTNQTDFIINTAGATDADKIKLTSAGTSKLQVQTATGQAASLEVEELILTGTEAINWEGNAVIASEFVAVNNSYDFASNGLSGLYGNTYGLKVKRDVNDDDATVLDGVKLGWTEKNATGTGNHGNWTAEIIYSDGSGGNELTYQGPLAYKLDGGSTSFPGAALADPGDAAADALTLCNAAEIGTMFVGSDSSLWIKTS